MTNTAGTTLKKEKILLAVKHFVNGSPEIFDENFNPDSFEVFKEQNKDIKNTDLTEFVCILNGGHKYVEAISFTCHQDCFVATTYVKGMSAVSKITPNTQLMKLLEIELYPA